MKKKKTAKHESTAERLASELQDAVTEAAEWYRQEGDGTPFYNWVFLFQQCADELLRLDRITRAAGRSER